MRSALIAAFVLLVLAAGPSGAETLDDLLADLRLIPMKSAAPPPLALERLADGKTITLAQLRGRPVLVYFWATW